MPEAAPAAPATAMAEPAAGEQRSEQSAQQQAQKKWVLKDGDVTHEVTSEDELVNHARKSWAANRRFEEASKIKKMIDDEMNGLRSKDRNAQFKSAQKFFGGEEALLDFAEAYLMKKINYNALSDEQKKILALEEETNTYRSKEQEQIAQQAHAELDEEIRGALAAYEGKPTIRMVMRMAEDMLAHTNVHGSKLTAIEALRRAEVELGKDANEYVQRLPIDQLIKFLSPQQLEALRKHNVDQVLSQSGRAEPRGQQRREAPSEKTQGKKDWDSYWAEKEGKFK